MRVFLPDADGLPSSLRSGAALIFVGTDNQPAFGDVERSFDVARIEQFGCFLTEIKLARPNLADRNFQRSQRRAQSFGLRATFFRRLSLGVDVIQMQRVHIGQIGIGLGMANGLQIAAGLQRRHDIGFAGQRR